MTPLSYPLAPRLAPHSQANIGAAKAVSDIVRTTLGPKAMLKMLLDPMGGIGASCLSALSIRMRAKVFAE